METLTISHLTVNDLDCPLGIDRDPVFSYRLQSTAQGQKQTARRIVLSKNADLSFPIWDSGRMETRQSVQIPYAGPTLQNAVRYYWQVTVWSGEGQAVQSEAVYFETGLGQEDWQGKWISGEQTPVLIGNPHWKNRQSAQYLRKSFYLQDAVDNARVYICGLGYFKLYINGKVINGGELEPAFTRYDKTAMYLTYTVENLQEGENVIGVILGNGWFDPETQDTWNYKNAEWRDNPKLLLQLETFAHGEKQMIISDRSFKCSEGPITFNQLRNGEHYDARRALGEWTKPGYDDGGWKPTTLTKGPGGVLRSQSHLPIAKVEEWAPVAIVHRSEKSFVADFGKNTAGWVQLRVAGREGTEIKLVYSEKLHKDGTVDQSNINPYVYSGEFQTDRYICKGEEPETWHPVFTYHGFRFVEVSWEGEVQNTPEIVAQQVHTAFSRRGSFTCSDERINRLQEMAVQSTVTNFAGMPTDCPHREKNGWTGDASLSAEQTLYNLNPMTVYARWLKDFADAMRENGQLPGIIPTAGWGYNWGSGPAWDSALLLIPWYQYLTCADTLLLQEMYPSMVGYMSYCDTLAQDGIICFGLGDWCHPAPEEMCETMVTDTAYYYNDTLLLSKIADILNKKEDAADYRQKADFIKKAFRRRFIRATGDQLELNCRKCQTSLACMLYQGLTEPEEEALFTQELLEQIAEKNGHLYAGILGAKYVLHVLAEQGHAKEILPMLTDTEFPSWGYMLAQGATTLWENWNGEASQNHHMYSDFSAVLYQALGGICPDEEQPGFARIHFRPQIVEELEWVRASHECLYGQIMSAWEKQGDNRIKIELQVPVNTTALLHIPYGFCMADGTRDAILLESGSYMYILNSIW